MSDPITWHHTWPERGSDFVAVVAGGSFGRIYRTYDDSLRQGEWVWNLTYPAATRLPKAGRAKTKQKAADAVHAGLDAALRWHVERGQPLLLWRHGLTPEQQTDWRMREPLRLVLGQDMSCLEGWLSVRKRPARDRPSGRSGILDGLRAPHGAG